MPVLTVSQPASLATTGIYTHAAHTPHPTFRPHSSAYPTEVHLLEQRISEIDARLRWILRSRHGLVLVACATAILALGLVALLAFAMNELGLAMLFAAIDIMAAPFAGIAMSKAAVPLWRLANERERRRERVDLLLASVGLPPKYTPIRSRANNNASRVQITRPRPELASLGKTVGVGALVLVMVAGLFTLGLVAAQ